MGVNIYGKMESRRLELVECIVAAAEACLKKAGISVELAETVAVQVAYELMDLFGGQLLVFPSNYKHKLRVREDEIYDKFTGSNYAELAQEYKMGERGMRKLISRVTTRRKKAGAA